MSNSQEQYHASKKGCFSGVLHRFLCSGGLPTHPSFDIEESVPAAIASPTHTTTTPAGVVARLMGLDSFPNSPKLTLMQKSRSLGSLDLLSNFHITKQPPLLHHRPVTSSLSFREVFLHDLPKSDMPFTPIQEKSTNILKQRVGVNTNMRNNNNNNNMKKKKKKKNNTIKKRPSHVKMVKNGEEEVPLKITRKRRVVNGVKKKLYDDHIIKYKSRSKTYNHPLPKMGRKEKKKTLLKRRESEDYYCIQVLKEVCRLTMVEIEGVAWVDAKVVDCYNIQQVSYEIGQQILQLLLYEMVDDLIM